MEHFQRVVGKELAELDAAHGALLPRDRPFDEWRMPSWTCGSCSATDQPFAPVVPPRLRPSATIANLFVAPIEAYNPHIRITEHHVSSLSL